MTYEIHANERGEPYLKKVIRTKSLRELGRGQWMPIGRATDHGINRVVELNLLQGHLVTSRSGKCLSNLSNFRLIGDLSLKT